jgi:ribosome-associated protein
LPDEAPGGALGDNPPMQEEIPFELRGEYIELDKLLKATGLADSGGVARMMITEQQVRVDGQTELRKTAKIRAGQVVSLQGARIRVLVDPRQD